jgi:hypothetical protein
MACASADSGASASEPPHAERVAATASAAQDGSPPPSKRHTADDRSSPQDNFPARRRHPASVPGPLPLFRATQERLGVECRPIGRFSPSEAGNAKAGRTRSSYVRCALRTPRSRSQFSARQPSFEQTIRAEGSWPARTRASTALRPCVLKAIRVSFATVPRSRLAIAVRDTSTTVEACRPSSASSRTTQEAPTSFEPGLALTDSLTRHATASP